MIYNQRRAMTAKRLTNFRLEDELLEGMQAVKDREGLSLTVQVRIAVADGERLRHPPGSRRAPDHPRPRSTARAST